MFVYVGTYRPICTLSNTLRNIKLNLSQVQSHYIVWHAMINKNKSNYGLISKKCSIQKLFELYKVGGSSYRDQNLNSKFKVHLRFVFGFQLIRCCIFN